MDHAKIAIGYRIENSLAHLLNVSKAFFLKLPSANLYTSDFSTFTFNFSRWNGGFHNKEEWTDMLCRRNPANQLGWDGPKTLQMMGINYQPQLVNAGLQPSTVWRAHFFQSPKSPLAASCLGLPNRRVIISCRIALAFRHLILCLWHRITISSYRKRA